MFSGIISALGTIRAIDRQSDWTLEIQMPGSTDAIKIGDSIACSGVCLTVVVKSGDSFTVQVSQETLDKTTICDWQEGRRINLEASLRLGDTLDGHLVYGHVDGVAQIQEIRRVDDSHRIAFKLPQNLAKYVAQMGSVALNGVSLTVNGVRGVEFDVNIIPFTWQATDFQFAKVGDFVNVEIDIMARYAERLMNFKGE